MLGESQFHPDINKIMHIPLKGPFWDILLFQMNKKIVNKFLTGAIKSIWACKFFEKRNTIHHNN